MPRAFQEFYLAALRDGRFADVGVFFAVTAFFGLKPGSPVAAFSTSPPPSRAISARSLLLTMECGFSMATSFVEVYWSRCLISSHDFPELLPQPCVRTNTQEPFNFLPWSANFRSPFVRAALTSGDSGVQVPSSHTMTVPPPYSPSGMTPSKLAYSTGWSSTCIARRLTEESSEGPLGTAQESSTPFHSRRKS